MVTTMESQPFFSVVIPAYNAEKYIDSTIQSVINQTFSDWELVVVDDCSKDTTAAIVESCCEKDRRIRLIKCPRNFGGPAGPRNIGIRAAKGSFIALLDSDDIWLPEKLTRVFAKIESTTNDIFYHKEMRFEKQPGDTSIVIRTANANEIKNLFFYLLTKGNIFSPSAIVIRKEILLQELFDEDSALHGVEDYDLWIRLARKRCYFCFINEVLGNYRIHPDGISRNFRKHGIKERTLLKRTFAEFSSHKFPGMAILRYYKLVKSVAANAVRSFRYQGLSDLAFYAGELLRICWSQSEIYSQRN